ncbi:MAG: ribosomal protein S18-alanine N-acetyltransferase [Lachnospiraceae bacterium]|nr:ribosomal protein S18-alanine N-acetyltransferase [Parasporobacterium sp.]MBR4168319.1 ribosomal protein S18-alanine N-acetyltransferase [Lachnospiraceae bacterium]MCR4685458.1 ribosomal protein S18-alanine N-acetyltransferase [Lachnospiraceae bacterium]
MASEVTIRPMTDEDVPAVSAIEEATFSMPWKPDDFREMIRRDNMTYLVVETDGKIVGGAGMRNILGDGEITNVAILAEYRRQGLGKRLLVELLKTGKELGADAFTLEVRAGNEAAIRLYESLGFVSEGVRPDFYERPREDALIMWKR